MDSSVLFQALYSSRGVSHAVFRLVRDGAVKLALSVPVYGEYQDLLSRPATKAQLALNDADVRTILEFIAFVGVPYPIRYLWRPNLRDENDNMFIELALASGSQYLITQNIRDFTVDAELSPEPLAIVTPAEFLNEWRRSHGQ
jgi:putative PIN family toxin of toxin-antitoxin system